MGRTLQREGNPLAVVDRQREILRPTGRFPGFHANLESRGLRELRAVGLRVLQINVGRMCNQTCKHCHVDAGPDRKEIMSLETIEQCVDFLAKTGIPVVDVTGGAPEMNPHFRWLVEECRRLGRSVIDRCNLTILLAPGYDDLPEFLASQEVEIVASLPYYAAATADRQRGDGVFEKSIVALRRLNAIGYGMPGSPLKLNLVYNPTGAFLPARQSELEELYRRQLAETEGVSFHSLYAITNQPINRFLEFLLRTGNYEAYMSRLIEAFNPATVAGLMCRDTISVGWDGQLYDCDFNQMLDMGLASSPMTIANAELPILAHRPIATGLHCYACTAGGGSSCGGETAQ